MSIPDSDDGTLVLERPLFEFLPLSAAGDVKDVAKQGQREWAWRHASSEPEDAYVVDENPDHTVGNDGRSHNKKEDKYQHDCLFGQCSKLIKGVIALRVEAAKRSVHYMLSFVHDQGANVTRGIN